MTDTTQPVKKPRGRNGGRTVGAKNTVTSEKILKEIALHTGKPFEKLLAEGYLAAILSMDYQARLAYEKLILNKVIGDKHSMDITSGGQSLVNTFNFTKAELPEWQTPQLKLINAKSE